MPRLNMVDYDASFECSECGCRFAVDTQSGEEFKDVEFCPKCGEPSTREVDVEFEEEE